MNMKMCTKLLPINQEKSMNNLQEIIARSGEKKLMISTISLFRNKNR